ncbi:MAG: glutathione S-transferase N-terminal domain-containing protein [Gammaproteobacteria bacterium]
MNEPDDAATHTRLALYHSELCWFCARVRQTMKTLGLELELRDVDREPTRRQELVAGGGKGQVPCLRIEDGAHNVTWMYESADISAYLERNFGGR